MLTKELTRERIEDILTDWPDEPRQAAHRIMHKYGVPDEATGSMLIWYNNGPWKKSVIFREKVPHRFPKPHSDVLEQVIDYKVPAEKFDGLARFDGSVMIERTKGEISARCDREAANFLALNLAHDIVTNKRTVEEARESYAEKIKAFMKKDVDPYMKDFQFKLPTGDTRDPDATIIKGMM